MKAQHQPDMEEAMRTIGPPLLATAVRAKQWMGEHNAQMLSVLVNDDVRVTVERTNHPRPSLGLWIWMRRSRQVIPFIIGAYSMFMAAAYYWRGDSPVIGFALGLAIVIGAFAADVMYWLRDWKDAPEA